jgi:hypothetical protein
MFLVSVEAHMETHRLKMRIGAHEFEAEGTEEAIDRRLEAFKELVAMATIPSRSESHHPSASSLTNGGNPPPHKESNPLAPIFNVTGKPMTLTALPSTPADGLLLLLLGHRSFNGNDQVPVSELLSGLKTSGFSVERMDDITPRLLEEHLILKNGKRNASKYRLTTTGAQRADVLAGELIEKVY